MKKILLAILCFTMLFAFTGCSASTDEGTKNEISADIKIEVVGGKVDELTTADFEKLEMVEKDLVMKKKGDEEELKLKGVLAKDLISYISDGYETVTLIAEDGYENTYDIATIDAEDSIFAVYSDGKELTTEDGLVWFAAGSQPAKKWMKNVSQIIFDKSAEENKKDEKTEGAKTDGASDFSIAVESEKSLKLTKADFDKIGAVEKDATIKKKDKDPETNKWTGYVLKDVLEANGITEYTSLTIEAADGFGNEYTKDVVDSGILVGILMDGQPLEEGTYPMLVVDGEGGNMWVKGMSKITVNK